MSQCGLFYKIIVTCLAVGVSLPASLASQDDMSAYNDYPYLLQVAPSEGVLARLVGDALTLGTAGSASYSEDGAEPQGSIVTGEYRRQRVRGVSNVDPLHTAAQSYYIEPEVPTTTTKRPMFKKRKTKRPITVLALKKKPAAFEGENHNEPPQGNPAVVFSPMRQIGFRKRPSSGSDKPDQLDRPKIRVRAKPRTAVKPVEEKEIVNEIPVSTTEGEPRALGRRKPPQDVRPITPERPLPESETYFKVEEPETGRFPPPPQELIKPATIANNNVRPSPRTFGSRPRPTTTISSSDEPGTTQPQPPPRRKALRPLATSRFNNANANRPTPSANEAGPVSPVRLPRRRPLRPTTTQEATTIPTLPPTTVAPAVIIPDDINNGIVVLPPFSAVRKDPPTTTPPRQVQTRPGFTLRPRPTTAAEPTRYSRGRTTTPADEDVATPSPVNTRRKRPQSGRTASGFQTETITEGVVPARQNQGGSPPRRVRPITRSRPVPSTGTVLPPFPGSRAAQRTPAEETKAPPTENETEEDEKEEEKPEAAPAPVHASPPRHYSHSGFHSSPLGPNFGLGPLDTSFPNGGLFGPDSLTQNPSIHNILGSQSSSNFRPSSNFHQTNFQHQPFFNQFSSRTTQSYLNQPHISDIDFQLAASTEKEAIAEAPADIKAANDEKIVEPSSPIARKQSGTSAKISALEKLQNRQAAARRFLTPRKPTEKTTEVPTVVNMKTVNNFRKSIIPPRMLRSGGKSQAESSPQNAEERMDTGPMEMEDDMKPEGMEETVKESGIINETSASASTDTETNVVPISPKAEEEGESASRKPSILENAKRRRMPFPSRSWMNSDNMKITPAPASEQNPNTPPPTCEDGRRYSKFLKRCVTMYKPKIASQG